MGGIGLQGLNALRITIKIDLEGSSLSNNDFTFLIMFRVIYDSSFKDGVWSVSQWPSYNRLALSLVSTIDDDY